LKLRYVRLAIAAAVIGFLFFYFVPVIPVGAAFSCNGGASLCLSDPTGLVSLGYSLFHSGGIYSFEIGYIMPSMSVIIGGVQTWVTLGWLEVYLLIPIGCVLAGLLSPEIVDGIHVVSFYLGELIGRSSPRNHSAS
jgi:hypothetical protein